MGKMSIKWANRTPLGLELRCNWFNPEIEAFKKVMLVLRPQVEHIVSVGDASFFFHMAASLSKTLRLRRSLLSVLSSPRLTPLSAFSSSHAPPPPPTFAAASSGSQAQGLTPSPIAIFYSEGKGEMVQNQRQGVVQPNHSLLFPLLGSSLIRDLIDPPRSFSNGHLNDVLATERDILSEALRTSSSGVID